MFENLARPEEISNPGGKVLETRRARRYSCGETMDCEARGGVRIVLMKDFSMLGARLEGTGLPEVGGLVRLSPTFNRRGREWVFAQICWVRRTGGMEEAGLRFLEPLTRLQSTWVGRFVAGKDSAERRRSIRVPTEVYMEVKLPGQRTLETTSVDVSEGGARIRLPRQVQPGEVARLQMCLPYCMLDVAARVVRSSSREPFSSVRFGQLSPGHADALESFLQQELAVSAPSGGSRQSWLRLLNRER